MESIKEFINALSYPKWSFTLSLVLFAYLVKSKRLWTKTGGVVMFLVATALFI